MAVVIGVMWIAARLMKGRQVPGTGGIKLGSAPKHRAELQVLARQGVGRHATVSVVRAGNKSLVLGITEQNISLLAELDDTELALQDMMETHGTGYPEAATLVTAGSARTGLLSQIRERTVRRV